MKVMIIGSSEVWSIENYYIKYLHKYDGLDIQIVSTSEFFHRKRFVDRIIKRFFPNKNNIYTKFNKHIYEAVTFQQPDILLVFKGMEVYPSTIHQIKQKGIKVANYNPDHPFIFHSRGSGNKNILESLGLYDLCFSYSANIIKTIQEKYNLPCVYLPFGYELEEKLYEEVKKQEEINKICFIGNPDIIRIQHIQALLQAGLPVDVYGYGWDRYLAVKHYTTLNIFPAVYGNAFWKVAFRYRLQLNIFRPHNIGSHNMRTFEMPAAGAIMLAPDSPEHQLFFEDGQEAFFYTDRVDMVKKTQQVLGMTKLEADKIRQNARKRSLESDYSYKNRAATVFHTLNEILSHQVLSQ